MMMKQFPLSPGILISAHQDSRGTTHDRKRRSGRTALVEYVCSSPAKEVWLGRVIGNLSRTLSLIWKSTRIKYTYAVLAAEDCGQRWRVSALLLPLVTELLSRGLPIGIWRRHEVDCVGSICWRWY